MNRRSFISLLAGAAGAPLVPWRGLVEPVISLPPRPHICVDSFWCNHPSHAATVTVEEIQADIERCLRQLLKNSGPVPYTNDGWHYIQASIGKDIEKFVPPNLSFQIDGQTFVVSH